MSDNIKTDGKEDATSKTDEAVVKVGTDTNETTASSSNETQVETPKESQEENQEELEDKVKAEHPVKPSQAITPISKTDLQALDYTDFSTPARMLALGEVLVKSKLVSLKTPQDVMTALMVGKELGLSFMTSVSNIYAIESKPTLGVHIQRALIIGAGILFEKIEDAEPIYAFAKADENGNTIYLPQGNPPQKAPIIVLKGTLKDQPEGTTKAQIDTRTTYQFRRMIKMADGSYREQTAKGSFSLSEAAEAGLSDKSNWIKYWRRMLDARAFTNGASEIASDILKGYRSPNELSNNFYINEANEEVP